MHPDFDLKDLVQSGKGLTFVDAVWPRLVLPIREKGRGNYFCLDATTGHMLLLESGVRMNIIWLMWPIHSINGCGHG